MLSVTAGLWGVTRRCAELKNVPTRPSSSLGEKELVFSRWLQDPRASLLQEGERTGLVSLLTEGCSSPPSCSRLFPASGAQRDIYLGTKTPPALPDTLMPKPHAGLFFLVSNAESNAQGQDT